MLVRELQQSMIARAELGIEPINTPVLFSPSEMFFLFLSSTLCDAEARVPRERARRLRDEWSESGPRGLIGLASRSDSGPTRRFLSKWISVG